MGNFYTNIALRTRDADGAAAALEEMRRHAFVAASGDAVAVYDERCDEQDLEALETLAGALSQRLGCVALAVCNHDDDVLWYALSDNGEIIDRYESNPSFFEGGRDAPQGGDAKHLCTAFGVPDRYDAVDRVLRRRHGDVTFEVERHAELLRLLGLPEPLFVLGYRYVVRGELEEAAEMVREVGSTARSRPRESLNAAAQRAAEDMFRYNYSLALSEADVPERFAPIFRTNRGNGQLLFARLMQYLISRRLLVGARVRADDLVADLLGEREFDASALARLLATALGIPPLSDDDMARVRSGDPEILGRLSAAIEAAQRDAGHG